MSDNKTRALKKACALLKNETPLGSFDCGNLCAGRCCEGDSLTGMWLFPGEEQLVKGENFTIIETEANYGCPAVVCGGKCKRDKRPLSCRFFPLVPVIVEEEGRETVKAMIDPRAGICPLSSNEKLISRRFIRAVRRAGKCLAADDEIREYMKKISSEMLEIIELRSLLEEDVD